MINLRYANINSKLKGMHARFLSKEDLYQLSKQKNFKVAVYFLKNELDVLKNIDENADRLMIEKELDRIIINDINKIKRLLNNKEQEIFEKFISKYEINRITEVYKYIRYFKSLFFSVKTSGKDLTNLIGEKIDLLNIEWIYRMKKYYKLPEEKIRNNLIDVQYKIKEKEIKDLLNVKDFEEMKKIIKSTEYAKIAENIDETNLEHEIDKYFFRKCKKEFEIAKYNLNTVFCYMFLQEFQKKNLINILGGISYGLGQKEIENKIIT